MDLLMNVCAEPETAVMFQAYPLNTVLPEHLVRCPRWAADSCSLLVPLSPESLVLTCLFYLELKQMDFPFPCLFCWCGRWRQVIPLQGICPLQDMFLLILFVDGG